MRSEHEPPSGPPLLTSAAADAEGGSVLYVYLVCAVAAVGGLLFGFDTAIISNAIGPVTKEFALDEHEQGFAVSSILVGCVFGASFAGLLADRFGRKKVLIVAALFYVMSAGLSAIPRDLTGLVIARFLGGLAVGVSSLVSPLYIAEIAPARIRGRLVSLQQMAIVTGILLAYFVGWLLVGTGPNAWRWMFASEMAPAAILLLALLFVPESPRWLTKLGRADEAASILRRVGGAGHARLEMVEIQSALRMEEGRLSELLRPGFRVALLIAVTLAVLQQISGINTIVYYAPRVFARVGHAESAAAWATVLVGVTNVVCTLIALWIIDKVGRRALLLGGSAGMFVCLALAAVLLPRPDVPAALKLGIILGYIAFFGVGLGATVWVVIAEIFPTKIRGRAMAIATVSLWVACFAVAQTFPWLIETLGERCFWIYAGMCVVMFVFSWTVVTETRGQSLEAIERMWRGRGALTGFPVIVVEPTGDSEAP